MHRRTFIRQAAGTVLTGTTLAMSRPVSAVGGEPSATIGESPFGGLGLAPDENGILLPEGFTSRVVAISGEPPVGDAAPWHVFPDGGATFPDTSGGWFYVSNSEVFPTTAPDSGGVSSLHFDADGNLLSSRQILSGSNSNCAGGPTPWGTWLSCEEHPDGQGRIWECDPTGAKTAMAHEQMGRWRREAVAVDPVDKILYMTEDHPEGRLYRYLPSNYPDLSEGSVEVCSVDSSNQVTWTNITDPSGTSAPTHSQVPESTIFPGNEGIWYHGGWIYFCTKHDHSVHGINLRTMVYQLIWKGDPDSLGVEGAVLSGVDNITVNERTGDLYVAEDGGNMEIVLITADGAVVPFLRITNQDDSEITGPAFSPDGKRMYFSSQRGPANRSLGDALGIENGSTHIGITYEVTGPFDWRTTDDAPAELIASPTVEATPVASPSTTLPLAQTAMTTQPPISLPTSSKGSGSRIALGGVALTAAAAALFAWRQRQQLTGYTSDE